jgi:murein DD-endopeptidase MepM/ murein hydrolase activator NlpD
LEKGRIPTGQIPPANATRKIRALVVVAVVSLVVAIAAFGTAREAPPPSRQLTVEQLMLPTSEVTSAGDTGYWHETLFARGDTFASMLHRLGVDAADTRKLIREHGGAKPFRHLRPGMTVQAHTAQDGGLLALRFLGPSQETVLGFERDGEDFRAIDEPPTVRTRVFLKAGEIRTSLFAAADDVGMPDSITSQIADIFSGHIDFHRDLRRGDRFAVIYEVLYDNGRALRAGRVLAAEFVNDESAYRALWFVGSEGKGGYYTPEGKSLRKAFLRSPLEFSRITSGFAMRFHPILKVWRAHKGVDYGAPAGTRVRATADGTVEFAGNRGGYGNAIVLRHHAGITTLYGHLRGFAAGVRKGRRIAQGEVIGYVGATGWATGPHLHYEFRVRDAHRDPLTVQMPAAEPVPRRLMAAFRVEAQSRAAQLDLLSGRTLAGLD